MKELWKLQVDWDEQLPSTFCDSWDIYKSSLHELEKIRVPRFVGSDYPIHLVGFSDASEKGLAAAVYLYSEVSPTNYNAHLLTAKTRIADSSTLPRLELNAAVLLAEMMNTVKEALRCEFASVRAYTDSTITLAWIKSDPNRWKTYLRNRVIKIQDNIQPELWHHIAGEHNPADCASRGLNPDELLTHSLWWRGYPVFTSSTISIRNNHFDYLEESTITMSNNHFDETVFNSEAKKIKVYCAHVSLSLTDKFIQHYSTLTRLTRAAAILIRFVNFLKFKRKIGPILGGYITAEEMKHALHALQYNAQIEFNSEISCLNSGKSLPINNKILPLSPVLIDGLLCVGGRLKKSNLNQASKHPILLPRRHHITNLIIRQSHIINLHAGPQGTLAHLNQRYWILRGRDAARHHIKKCATCVRQRGETMTQLMGNLPEARVTPSRPFTNCGVDYAGPFTIKNYGRSKVTYKCWLVLFVCFATKALHLELATTLSTEVFLAAFRRFCSRRGRPSNVYSDCGTNFVGAKRTLEELPIPEDIATTCAAEGISWHLNPPGSPHFGGLWEAGVKSVKHHLRRVLGPHTLTYEEMLTLVTQIEGILNSRPITPLSTDPDDLAALTPAHFLIGAPLNSAPDENVLDLNINRLSRWQLIQRQQQEFWSRWHKEYITRMQQRPKWMKIRNDINVNDIVIIKDDNLPPTKWRLGRVLQKHTGDDGITRVVTLKTQQGDIKRSIHKLCLLPTSSELDIAESSCKNLATRGEM